jgi:hypothetical protein
MRRLALAIALFGSLYACDNEIVAPGGFSDTSGVVSRIEAVPGGVRVFLADQAGGTQNGSFMVMQGTRVLVRDLNGAYHGATMNEIKVGLGVSAWFDGTPANGVDGHAKILVINAMP